MSELEQCLGCTLDKFWRIQRQRATSMGAGADADDWAQEAVLRVWLVVRRHGIPSTPGYLWRTANNCLVDLLRHQRRMRQLPAGSLDAIPIDEDYRVVHPLWPAPEYLGLQDLVPALQRTVSGRMILQRAGGMHYSAMAARWSIPLGTVKSRLAHGRKVAQREFARLYPELDYYNRAMPL